MSSRVTIVMYHFVRELPYTRYPRIKGLRTSHFAGQLDYLQRHYRFVTMEQCLEALQGGKALPERAVLLTFDDGYCDHFTDVFPLLDARGIQGSFFPPARPLLHHEVLDVNKIHFLLASLPAGALVEEMFRALDTFRGEFDLADRGYYTEKLAHPNRFDTAEVILFKRMLQAELPEALRARVLGELFRAHVASDEAAFARELYLSVDQLRCMIRRGMFVGSHGHDHVWLNKVSPERQVLELDLSLEFLAQVGAPTEDWVMCYPYGGYDDRLLGLLQERRVGLALTNKLELAVLEPASRYTLPRLDTNDLPTQASAEPSPWTAKA